MATITWPRIVPSLIGASVLLLGGCSHASSQELAAPSLASKTLLAPRVSPVQNLNIFDALESLKRSCMRSKGFKYYGERVSLRNFMPKGDPTDPLYIDTHTLRTGGYGLYASSGTGLNGTNAPGVPGSNPEQVYVRDLDSARLRAYGVALEGTGKNIIRVVLPDGKVMDNQAGGCNGFAYQKLYGATTKYPGMAHYLYVFTFSYDIYDDAWKAAEDSAPYVRAESVWTACMRRAGLAYQTRGDVYADLLARYRAHGARRSLVRRYEMKAARADAGCVEASGLNPLSERQMAVAAGNFSRVATRALRAWDEMDAHAAVRAARMSRR